MSGDVQWKGTDVCIDLECECGWDGHFDGYFMYHIECPGCEKIFKAETAITFTPLEEGCDAFCLVTKEKLADHNKLIYGDDYD